MSRAALPSDKRQVQADVRTHLIHHPARDIFPPLGGVQVLLLSRTLSTNSGSFDNFNVWLGCGCNEPGAAGVGACSTCR
jgi:hypothetical protein